MAQVFYDTRAPDRYGLLRLVIVANILASAAGCAAWTTFWPLVADDVIWALGPQFGGGIGSPFDYPHVLVWSLPAVCAMVAWALMRLRLPRLAWPVVLLPAAFAGALYGAEIVQLL